MVFGLQSKIIAKHRLWKRAKLWADLGQEDRKVSVGLNKILKDARNLVEHLRNISIIADEVKIARFAKKQTGIVLESNKIIKA